MALMLANQSLRASCLRQITDNQHLVEAYQQNPQNLLEEGTLTRLLNIREALTYAETRYCTLQHEIIANLVDEETKQRETDDLNEKIVQVMSLVSIVNNFIASVQAGRLTSQSSTPAHTYGTSADLGVSSIGRRCSI
ncbi:DUF1758 domain-containing protein [Sergentomyia squamirostris]